MTTRGDIVMVSFPFSDGSGAKIRPSLVVQNEADSKRLDNTVVAMITGNISHAHESTQLLIDPSTPDGQHSGLRGPSVVKCNVLVTVSQRTILRTLGRISAASLQKINECLKVALDLP